MTAAIEALKEGILAAFTPGEWALAGTKNTDPTRRTTEPAALDPDPSADAQPVDAAIALTHDKRAVVIHGAAHTIFTQEQTLEIADLFLANFER